MLKIQVCYIGTIPFTQIKVNELMMDECFFVTESMG